MDIGLKGLGEDWKFHSEVFERKNEIIYPFSIGNPNIQMPDIVKKSIMDAIYHNDTHYMPVRGNHNVNQLLAEIYNVSISNVQVTHGAQSGLYLSMKTAYLMKHKPFLIIDLPYLTTHDIINSLKAESYTIKDLNQLSLYNNQVGAVILMNPVSPTGKIWTKDDLEKIGNFCQQNDCLCISDEVYSDLIYKGKHTSVLDIQSLKDVSCVIYSASKSFAMPGLRMGWVISSEYWIKQISLLMSSTHASLSGAILSGLYTALQNKDEIINFVSSTIKERLDIFYPYVKDYAKYPDSGMFVLIDTNKPYELAQILANHNIASIPTSEIGLPNKLRLSFSHDPSLLHQGGSLLNDILKEELK
jgi:aspartate/methionine/tyrosine aminotransferase